MNAYSDRMCEDLLTAIAAFRDGRWCLRALMLTGSGERAFCTGGDLSGGRPRRRGAPAGSPRPPWATAGDARGNGRAVCWRCGD